MFRSRRRLRTAVLVATLALVATACQIDVQATTFHVVDAQEEAWYSNGDEPYIAVIKWRVTPGTPGSTQVSLLTELDDELASNMYDGSSVGIPAANGLVEFDNVTPVALQQVLTGSVPELLGTVVIAIESDNTPWGTINNLMHDVEASLATELANIVEPLTIADLTNPQVIADGLGQAAANVQAAITPDFWDSVLLFLGSLGDPDDVIGIGFTVWVATAGPLADVINASLPAALPGNAIGGAWSNNLNPVNGSLTFSGDGATYVVDVVATPTP